MRIVLIFLLLVSSLYAEIPIDSMSNVTSWTVENDVDAFGNMSSYTENSKVSLKFETTFNNGKWSQVSKKFKGIDCSVGDNLKFWYKATGGKANTFSVSLHNTNEKSIAAITADNEWHQVVVNLNQDPFNKASMESLNKIKIVVKGSGEGTIILDKLELYTNSTFIKVIDDFESASYHGGWTAAANNKNKLSLSTVQGLQENGVMLNYSFIDGEWVLIEKNYNINLTSGDFFKFKIKSMGEVNDLAVYFIDAKDWQSVSVTYGRVFHSIIGHAKDWITLTIASDELQYISSDDPVKRRIFNLNQIEKVTFRINQVNPSISGSMMLSDLAIDNNIDFKEEYDPNKLIQSLQIDNNPFTPNGDGWKDTCMFTYTLSETAIIKLKLYNLKGIPIKEIDMGTQSPGTETPIIWTGLDDNNKLVNNGMVVYFLHAKSTKKEDKIKGVIGVVK